MAVSAWCEHEEKNSKYTMVKHNLDDREIVLKVQTWICPICGIYSSDAEVVQVAEK